jgi:hypothetical protein
MTALGYIIQGVSKILEQASAVCSPHQNKEKVHINIRVCPQTPCFQSTAPTFVRLQSFRLSSVGTFKKLSIQLGLKTKTHFTNTFFDTCHTVRNHLWKGATVHDQTNFYVHWFRRRTFAASAVNCDLTNHTNSNSYQIWNAYCKCVSCKYNIT